MCAHSWQGDFWRHDVSWTGGEGDTAILLITGWEPCEADLAEQTLLSAKTGMPVATLFQVPAQPLFGLSEDDLIAHTFVKFLETGAPDWPLLLPMARSVLATMDAIQEAFPSIRRFVLSGVSKRAWTTWMAAATGDPRIAGIAPVAFDHLNMKAQLEHQTMTWGATSEMMQPYTERGLIQHMDSALGLELTSIVDPIAYVERLQMPKLITLGTNDPFWQVDALKLYVDLLPGPTTVLCLPNEGHVFGDKTAFHQTLAAFCRGIADFRSIAGTRARVIVNPDGMPSLDGCPASTPCQIWFARSSSLDFRLSTWQQWGGEHLAVGNFAIFGSLRQEQGYTVSTPIQVFEL